MNAKLSPELVAELMGKGMKQAQIAREYGVTRQYINMLARKAGMSSVVTIVSKNMPWAVGPQFHTNHLYRGVRLHGHYSVGGPTSIEEASKVQLRNFYKKLMTFNQVIDYSPDYPAIPGVTNTPGFAYVPRTPTDEDYIIKIRPGVRLTPEGKKIWRLPKQLP